MKQPFFMVCGNVCGAEPTTGMPAAHDTPFHPGSAARRRSLEEVAA